MQMREKQLINPLSKKIINKTFYYTGQVSRSMLKIKLAANGKKVLKKVKVSGNTLGKNIKSKAKTVRGTINNRFNPFKDRLPKDAHPSESTPKEALTLPIDKMKKELSLEVKTTESKPAPQKQSKINLDFEKQIAQIERSLGCKPKK